MARIKIEDIPEEREISDEELDNVAGGFALNTRALMGSYTSPIAPRYVGLDPRLSSFGGTAASCGVCGVRG